MPIFDRIWAAWEVLLKNPHKARVVLDLERFEPLLLRNAEPTSGALERIFAAPSDIYAHLPTLYKLTVDRRLRRVLELGTRTGLSTLALLYAAKEIGGHVTSVDLAPVPEAQARVDAAGLRGYWTFVEADDLAIPWEEAIDHLFTDTAHTYEHTRKELAKFEPRVVPGGVISMHDTTSFPEVWRAIQDHFRGREDVRIFRYLHNNGLTLIEKGGPAVHARA